MDPGFDANKLSICLLGSFFTNLIGTWSVEVMADGYATFYVAFAELHHHQGSG